MDASHEAQSSTTAFSSDTPPFVFLSYAHADGNLVMHLQADLYAHGIAVWVDREGIQPGTRDWEEAVRKAIRASSAVVFAASPEARASRNVKDELSIADMYQRRVYPLWIAGSQWMDAAPIGWGSVQYLDGRGEYYVQAVEDLVATLSKSKVFTGTLPPSPPPISSPRNPYKGLRAFLREDVRDFFGRSYLTGQLVEAVEGLLSPNPQVPVTNLRFLTVLGPSGSGKSSVVMAGLLPQLQQGILPQSQEWIYVEPIVPGQRPIEQLTVVLSEHFPARSLTSIRQDLEADTTRGLHLLMTSLTKRSNAKVVLLIDQFEEVFTQTSSEEVRRRFLDLLITASTEPQGPVIVVVTLRADFYDRPLHYPELTRLIEAHRVLVLPMELQGLREVIEKPAQLPDVQLTFEQDLVGDLLFEIQGQPGALPLLQFTLDQLYERREGRQLTYQAYQDIGGVKGALAKHAEATYLSLPTENHRRLCHALFLRLIEPRAVGQDATRRRAARSDLVLSDPKETETLEEVMTTFTHTHVS